MSMSGHSEREPHLFLVIMHGPDILIGSSDEPVSQSRIAPFPRPQLPGWHLCTLILTIMLHEHEPFRSFAGNISRLRPYIAV